MLAGHLNGGRMVPRELHRLVIVGWLARSRRRIAGWLSAALGGESAAQKLVEQEVTEPGPHDCGTGCWALLGSPTSRWGTGPLRERRRAERPPRPGRVMLTVTSPPLFSLPPRCHQPAQVSAASCLHPPVSAAVLVVLRLNKRCHAQWRGRGEGAPQRGRGRRRLCAAFAPGCPPRPRRRALAAAPSPPPSPP